MRHWTPEWPLVHRSVLTGPSALHAFPAQMRIDLPLAVA